MTYDISDEEKHQANRAIICVNNASKLLEQASNYLSHMNTPFKDNPGSKPDDIVNNRAVIRRFRDQAIENFNKFKSQTFECIKLLQIFSSDTQIIKLMKSLISSIEELDKKLDKFKNTFNDLESKDFSTDITKSMDDIQKQCDSTSDILEERLKSHIQNNILSTSWVDAVGKELQVKVEKKTPLLLDLSKQRQEQLNDVLTKNKKNT